MQQILRKIGTLLSVYYAYMLEYRAEIFLWVLSNSLPIILMGVWLEASQSTDFSLSGVEFARYFFSVFLIRQLTIVWVIWEFEKEVVQGKLSLRLLQPLDPVWHHVAAHLAERFTRLPFMVVLIGLFFWLYPQAIWLPNPFTLLLCAFVTLLAFSLRFIIQYTFAMFAFWTERASAIQQLWMLFYIFLSGMIAPLDVFPPLMRELTLWTPFPYLIYFPGSILAGLEVDLVRGLATICGWGFIFFVLNRWLWRKGLKQYSAMGS